MSIELLVEEIELPIAIDARWAPLALTEDQWKDIRLRTLSPTTKSLYMTASVGGEIVGFVAFIGHTARLGDQIIAAYQAARVLTAPAYRGRGIFPAVVRAAETSLRNRGAGFIFGFPNANAYPVWVRKLGYSVIPVLKWRAPALFGLSSLLIRDGGHISVRVIRQNDLEMIEMKRRLYGKDVIVAKADDALVWGVRCDYRRYGISAPLFRIGGLHFDTRRHLVEAYRAALQKAGQPVTVRFDTVLGNPANSFFAGVTETTDYHGMIIGNLNLPTLDDVAFGFFGGILDTF